MATYDLDRTELNHLLSSNIDAGARAAVVDYLLQHGGFEEDDHDHGHGHNDHGHDDHGHHDHGHNDHGGHNDRDFFGHQGRDNDDPSVKVQISNGGQGLDPKADVLVLTSDPQTHKSHARVKC